MKKIILALLSVVAFAGISSAGNIVINGATGGGTGSGGYALQPATVTIQASQGLTTTVETVSSSATFVSTASFNGQFLANGSAGTNGQFWTSGGPGTVPTWTTSSGSGTTPLYAFNGPVTDFISATTGTIVATTGVLPALAAGKCMSFKYIGYSNQNTAVNYKVWYSTAPNIVGFTVGGSSMAVVIPGISSHDVYFTGLICNQPGVQNAQRMMDYPLYSNVIGIGSYPDFYQTASVDATSTNLQVAITVDSTSSGILGETLQFVVAPMNY